MAGTQDILTEWSTALADHRAAFRADLAEAANATAAGTAAVLAELRTFRRSAGQSYRHADSALRMIELRQPTPEALAASSGSGGAPNATGAEFTDSSVHGTSISSTVLLRRQNMRLHSSPQMEDKGSINTVARFVISNGTQPQQTSTPASSQFDMQVAGEDRFAAQAGTGTFRQWRGMPRRRNTAKVPSIQQSIAVLGALGAHQGNAECDKQCVEEVAAKNQQRQWLATGCAEPVEPTVRPAPAPISPKSPNSSKVWHCIQPRNDSAVPGQSMEEALRRKTDAACGVPAGASDRPSTIAFWHSVSNRTGAEEGLTRPAQVCLPTEPSPLIQPLLQIRASNQAWNTA